MRKTRKTAALESLPNSVKLDENASTYTVELPLGLYQMEQ